MLIESWQDTVNLLPHIGNLLRALQTIPLDLPLDEPFSSTIALFL